MLIFTRSSLKLRRIYEGSEERSAEKYGSEKRGEAA